MSEQPQQPVDYQSLLQQAQQPPPPPIQQSNGSSGGEDISHLLSQSKHSPDHIEEYEDSPGPSGTSGLLLRYSGFIKSGILIVTLFWILQQPFFMSYVYKYVPLNYQTGHIFTVILGAILATMFLVLDELTPNFILNFIQ